LPARGIAQLPLYTISWTGTKREIRSLITASALTLAALGARIGHWPLFGGRMTLAAILLGLAYTVFSEWLNTELRQNWSYTGAMPILPPLGTGLTPFLQWLIVPAIALGYVGRIVKRSGSINRHVPPSR
jgi:hypothetical protein